MKASASILLLLSLLLPIAIAYGWLHYQKWQVQEAVKHQLQEGAEESELVELRFSKAEIQRLLRWEHSREFEYQGQMYDVVKMESTSDSVIYKCWWDKAETRLNQQLAQLCRAALQSDSKRQAHQQQLFWFFKTIYPPALTNWSFIPFPFPNLRKPELAVSLRSQHFPPPTPPPRFCATYHS